MRTKVARVVGWSRATRLTVASPGTLTVAQTRGTPRSPPEQEVVRLVVVMTDATATAVGARVTPADTEATLDTPAAAEAVAIPPLVGRTPASRLTVAMFPRPKVTQALTKAPLHDVETAVIVFPEMVRGVAKRAGTVTAADAMGKVALTPALARPPSLGKTPAPRVTVAMFPRPKVTQASMAAPEQDVETAVIVLPLIVSGVARTAGTVMAADATGRVALAPALTRPPSLGRTPAPRVTVAMFPRPKVTQASMAAPEHDVETAVIVLPEMVRGVAKMAGTVTAADAMGREALTPALTRPPLVGRASVPRLIVPRGPRPRLIHTLARPLPVHDWLMAVIVLPPITVLVGTTVTLVIAGVETGRAALADTMLPSVFRAPRVIVVEGPTPRAKQRTLLQDAVVVVITAPPGRVVGTLGAVIAGVERLAPVPTLMMLPSEFKAPSVTVVDGPTPRARQRTPLHDVAVLVTPGMLGTPVTTGVDPRPAPISMMLPSGLRAPSVAVTEGPTPRAKHTAPLH